MKQGDFTKLLALMNAVQRCGNHWHRNNTDNDQVLSRPPFRQLSQEIPDIFCKERAGGFNETKIILPRPSKFGKDTYLLLGSNWDFSGEQIEFRLRCGFLLKQQDKNQYNFTGFRYEAPEGPGNHNYYHAQPITSFSKNDGTTDSRQVSNIPWMPDSLPAFPLRASNPFELLVSMLVSLYGSNGVSVFKCAMVDAGAVKLFNEYLAAIE